MQTASHHQTALKVWNSNCITSTDSTKCVKFILHHISRWHLKLKSWRRLPESNITVTPSVTCMDWLHRWYNRVAHLLSSSTVLDFLNNMREKRRSMWLVQSKWYWLKTVGTEEKLDTISLLKEGWTKCYVDNQNVRYMNKWNSLGDKSGL